MKLFTFLSLFVSSSLMAQVDSVSPAPDQTLWQTLVMIAIAFLFFYVILWRPEQKKRQAVEEQRNRMKQGDRVVAMGIIGTVAKIGEQTVVLKMVDGSKIEMYKGAITDILPEESNKKEKLTIED